MRRWDEEEYRPAAPRGLTGTDRVIVGLLWAFVVAALVWVLASGGAP